MAGDGAAAGRSVPFEIWQTAGATEHLGGVEATRRLLERCQVEPGQLVLDLGCGTGYTACHLAERVRARVVAVDLGSATVQQAGQRVARQGVGHQVAVIQADAHHLPLRDGVLDVALAESVLVFCDGPRAAAELRRVLKPGGRLGANELTLLAPPPDELRLLLVDRLGIRALQEEEWRSFLKAAGFLAVESEVQPIKLRQQLAGHLEVDGLAGYLRALVRGLANVRISRAFLNREMLHAARCFARLVGYGLYTGRKGLV